MPLRARSETGIPAAQRQHGRKPVKRAQIWSEQEEAAGHRSESNKNIVLFQEEIH